MNIKKLSLVAALVIGAANVQATIYHDIDIINKQLDLVNLTVNIPNSHIGRFDIVTGDGESDTISGYPTGNGTFSDVTPLDHFVTGTDIYSAVASFYFTGVNGYETVEVDLGLSGFGLGDDLGTAVTLSGALTGTSITLIKNNGALNYTVSLVKGSVSLEGVTLTHALLTVNAVPDGGSTLMLLGLAVGGLGLLRRNTR